MPENGDNSFCSNACGGDRLRMKKQKLILYIVA
jgi:predicted nucleic acid-binding Zn ribbon protein